MLLYKGGLFQSNRPVLTGVDAHSTYCFLLEAVEHRDEDTWGWYLLEAEEQGLNPDYTIADAGVGIRAGQKAAWGDKPCHGDVWHIFDSVKLYAVIWLKRLREQQLKGQS